MAAKNGWLVIRTACSAIKMTTWTRAIRHPWFNPPTMKRRLSANNDGDDGSPLSFDVPPSPFSTGHRKRARYNSLERRLAHMTLGTPEEMDMWPMTSPPHPRDTLNVILPSSVEEPDTPASEPVDMEIEPTRKSSTFSVTLRFQPSSKCCSGHHRHVHHNAVVPCHR